MDTAIPHGSVAIIPRIIVGEWMYATDPVPRIRKFRYLGPVFDLIWNVS
jgi:hypothetical protein